MHSACVMGMGGMMWMMTFPALLLIATVVAGVVIARRVSRTSKMGGEPETSALQILEERYARGEIDREEFHERRNNLRASG